MNPDEKQLLSKVVDLNANIESQILRIACYDEYKANAYYQKVLDTYGVVAPFSDIAQVEVKHSTMIKDLCPKYNVTPPINDWYDKIKIGNTLTKCCQDSVDLEVENIEMYDNLLTYVAYDDIRDIFYKEQASSYNYHLPAFTQCIEDDKVQAENSSDQEQEHSAQHHDIYNLIQGLLNGNMDQAKLTQMLSSFTSRDMMLGLAAGAAITMAVTSDSYKDVLGKFLNNDENENSESKNENNKKDQS